MASKSRVMPQPQDSSAPSGSQMNPMMMAAPNPVQNQGTFGGIQPEKEEEKNPIEELIEDLEETEVDYLGRKASEDFVIAKQARLLQEQIWIRCHQNDKGVYPPDMDFGGGTSRAFVQITRPKVMNAHARLVEVLLPPGEDAWTLTPTPKPFMPELVSNMIAAGAPVEDINKAVVIASEKAADSMTLKTKDGLEETNWPAKLQETLLHMCLYGTSIVMGPLAVPAESDNISSRRIIDPTVKARLESIPNKEELIGFGLMDEDRPEVEVISPFDFYPDPGSRRIEDCSYAIIRKVINKSQLLDLAKIEGFIPEAIEELVDRNPNGNWTAEWWESVINVTNSQHQMNLPNGRFVVLVRWGYLSGSDLRKAGIKVEKKELNEQVMCQMWVSGSKVIFCQPSEMYRNRLPFYVTPYSIVPHVIWGAGPAEFMMDSQDGINACERAKYDNMAISSRPQVNINVDRLAPGQDALEIRAGRIWATQDSEINQGRPVEFFFPPSNILEIQKVQQDAMMFSDEQTNIPRNLMGMGGEGVHNRTSSGASLQFNNAITPLKGVAFNVDTRLVTPLINDMARFYLKYSKDKSIVGDFKVTAKGVSGLMAREVASQKLSTLMATAAQNENFAKHMDMERVFDIIMRGSGLQHERLILTQDEISKREEAAMQQQQIAQAAGAQMQANIQAEANNKMRAETSPRDILLQTMEAVPESCVTLKLSLIKEVLISSGQLTPEAEQAISHEMELEQMRSVDLAHEMGTNQSIREHGPMELHKLKAQSVMASKKMEAKPKKAGSK